MAAKKNSKFVQIAVSSDDGGNDGLYALDEAGLVWIYSWREEQWHSLSDNREAE